MKHDWKTLKNLGGDYCMRCAKKKTKRNAKANNCKPKVLELIRPVDGGQHG